MTFTEITLTLASGTQLPVQYMEGWEDLNQPTRLEINCPVTDLFEDTDALLGQAVTVSMQAGDHQRVWQLVIDRIQYHSEGAGEYWQFYLCSKLLWGTRLQRTRLFIDLSREQVLRQLLRECGYQDFEIELTLDPVPAPKGPYLQAQEDNLQCFHRLLAEVGGIYWLEHHPERHHETLVIRNDPSVSPYLEQVQWAQVVSGLAPDAQLNRITKAIRRVTGRRRRYGHAVKGNTRSLSRDDANIQGFEPPLSRSQAEQRALFQQQADEQFDWQLELHSFQPLLAVGYTLVLDASQLPVAESGEFRIHKVRHHARTAGSGYGLRYHNEAWVIRRTTPVRLTLAEQADKPLLFPAQIESHHDYAELSADGRYYLRPAFDQSGKPIAQASPLLERVSIYASPETEQAPSAGWHFPLLDQSTVLVSCLNNDPARMAILGFIPNRRQIGPVTSENASQSRIVTPSQNELLFDDDPYVNRIALFTFDGQNQCELCAQNEAAFAGILSQYGSLRLTAGTRLLINTGENLNERIGQHRTVQVKQNSELHTEQGAIRHQAATEMNLSAEQNIYHNSDGDYSLQAADGDIQITVGDGFNTEVSGGDMQVKVAAKATHQINGTIDLTSQGGNIVITDGTGGIQLDAAGNIKLWGKKITLNGQSGTQLNGDISYETGSGNEPESVAALEIPAIVETLELCLDGGEPIEGSPHSYEREIARSDNSEDWIELEIKNQDGELQAHCKVIITRADGRELLTQTDSSGRLHLRRSDMEGAKARVLGYTVE
ncbi:contractile injection system protein, VgrG/Pvc8 family [Gynuella sp.]|uniref:contractile injection system protein, VgrG/Pvc8 family n=1 Tax=Gynuella sp. TaxID=2969146 RepID=UPI003D0D8275